MVIVIPLSITLVGVTYNIVNALIVGVKDEQIAMLERELQNERSKLSKSSAQKINTSDEDSESTAILKHKNTSIENKNDDGQDSDEISSHGFTLSSKGCSVDENDIIKCSVLFENTSIEDKEIHINGSYSSYEPRSYLIGESGQKYSVEVWIGGDYSQSYIREIFPPNVPILVNFVSKKIEKGNMKYFTVIIGIKGFKNIISLRTPVK